MADDHRADVADADGRAVDGVHGDVLDVGHVADQPQPAHDVKFRAVLDIGAAGVAVAVGQGGEDLLQSEAVGLEFGRIHQHLVLLGQAAKGIDVHHARHRAEFLLHHPVFQRAHFLRRKTRRRPQGVAVNFADGRGIGRKARPARPAAG